VEVWRVVPHAAAVNLVYAGTPSNSDGRRVLAKLAASGASSHSGWPPFFDALPRDALLDIIKIMAAMRPGGKQDTKSQQATTDAAEEDTKSQQATTGAAEEDTKRLPAEDDAVERDVRNPLAKDNATEGDTRSTLAKDQIEDNVDVMMSDVMSEVRLTRFNVKP
jgi:hypothetical protein